MKLTAAQNHVLRALAAGCALKSHRHLDGRKEYRLHPLDIASVDVAVDVMTFLKDHDLIESNKKFPVASYVLTQKGKTHAAQKDFAGLSGVTHFN